MFKGYLALGGVEIINAARTAAYMQKQVPNFPFRQPLPLNGLQGVLIGLDGEYSSPLVDDAPWMDASNPATERFYGLYPLDIQGMSDDTSVTTITQGLGPGGWADAPRSATRDIRVKGVLVGADEQAVEAGMAWLKAALHPSDCGGGCEGEQLCYYIAAPPYCPIYPDDPTSSYTRLYGRTNPSNSPIIESFQQGSTDADAWTTILTRWLPQFTDSAWISYGALESRSSTVIEGHGPLLLQRTNYFWNAGFGTPNGDDDDYINTEHWDLGPLGGGISENGGSYPHSVSLTAADGETITYTNWIANPRFSSSALSTAVVNGTQEIITAAGSPQGATKALEITIEAPDVAVSFPVLGPTSESLCRVSVDIQADSGRHMEFSMADQDGVTQWTQEADIDGGSGFQPVAFNADSDYLMRKGWTFTITDTTGTPGVDTFSVTNVMLTPNDDIFNGFISGDMPDQVGELYYYTDEGLQAGRDSATLVEHVNFMGADDADSPNFGSFTGGTGTSEYLGLEEGEVDYQWQTSSCLHVSNISAATSFTVNSYVFISRPNASFWFSFYGRESTAKVGRYAVKVQWLGSDGVSLLREDDVVVDGVAATGIEYHRYSIPLPSTPAATAYAQVSVVVNISGETGNHYLAASQMEIGGVSPQINAGYFSNIPVTVYGFRDGTPQTETIATVGTESWIEFLQTEKLDVISGQVAVAFDAKAFTGAAVRVEARDWDTDDLVGGGTFTVADGNWDTYTISFPWGRSLRVSFWSATAFSLRKPILEAGSSISGPWFDGFSTTDADHTMMWLHGPQSQGRIRLTRDLVVTEVGPDWRAFFSVTQGEVPSIQLDVEMTAPLDVGTSSLPFERHMNDVVTISGPTNTGDLPLDRGFARTVEIGMSANVPYIFSTSQDVIDIEPGTTYPVPYDDRGTNVVANLALNPRAIGTGAAWFAYYGTVGAGALSYQVNGPYGGSAGVPSPPPADITTAARLSWSTAPTARNAMLCSPVAMSVIPGEQYTGLAYGSYGTITAGTITVRAVVRWMDGTGALISQNYGTDQVLVNGTTTAMTRLAVTAVAPDGAVSAQVGVAQGSAAVLPVVNNTLYATGAMLVAGDGLDATQPDGWVRYTDGSIVTDGTIIAGWEGAANNSASFSAEPWLCAVDDSGNALIDPDCQVVPDPPRPPVVPDSCIDDIAAWDRYYFTIPSDVVPANDTAVPLIDITTTSQEYRQVRMRLYANPFNHEITEFDPCSYCAEFILSYIPPSTTLTVDGEVKRATAVVNGKGPIPADSLLYGTDGVPITWPELTCGVPYIGSVDVPAGTVAPQLGISLALTRREG